MPSRWILALALLALPLLTLTAPQAAGAIALLRPAATMAKAIPVRGATCKTVGSCREAVELWCSGYSRADGDGDGIPRENVCRSRPPYASSAHRRRSELVGWRTEADEQENYT